MNNHRPEFSHFKTHFFPALISFATNFAQDSKDSSSPLPLYFDASFQSLHMVMIVYEINFYNAMSY